MADNRQYSDRQRLASLRHRAESINAFREDYFQNMFALLERDPNNDGLADMLASNLDDFEEQQRMNPNWLARPPQQDDLYPPGDPPDFIIGKTTETSVPWGTRMQDCGSIVISAIPGGGKTSLMHNVVCGVLANLPNVAILMFDPKFDTTCLAAIKRPNIRIVKDHEIRLNPMQPPPGTDLRGWLVTVATTFCETRGLKKSRHLFLDTMLHLCEAYGVTQDPCKPWPTLKNILEYLKRQPKTFGKDEYRQSLITELHGMLDDTGNLFDTADGIVVTRHMLVPGGLFALQVDSLPVSAQQFLITIVVEHIVYERNARNIHNPKLEVLICLDEAQLILGRAADLASSSGVAPLASKMLQVREAGVGFMIVAHLLPDIARAVRAAAKTVIVVGGLSDSFSIDVAAQMMDLPPRARTMISRLGQGQGLVREMGKCPYRDAYLVDFNPPPIRKDSIDEATRQGLMKPIVAAFPASPSRPLTNYPTVMADMNPGKTSPASATTASPQSSLAAEDMALLIDAATHRNDWIMERCSRLGIADYKQFEQRSKSLATLKLLVIHDIRLGKASYRLLEVTDAGFAAIHTSKPKSYISHGSFIHTVVITRVAAYLTANGWLNVYPERPVGANKHPVDIFGCSPAGINTAFEITLSTSNVVSNAVKTFAAPSPVQELIFLCPVMAECKTVEKLLRKDPVSAALLPNIKVHRIDEFLS